MASLATTDKCPYCLQNINQGQSQYGPICNNGHRAHLNCIMNQFDSNGTFNIDTWTCPICRAPAYYSPDSGIPSLNKVLRERFPRRIANLEEEEYSSEEDTDMEEEPDDSQNEELTIEDRLIQQYPFLGEEYRENEGGYRQVIMNGLTAQVRMQGVFPHTSQFQDRVDKAHMGDILLTQWYNMYNVAQDYEGEGDMEEVHSSLSNQSDFFKMLTMAVLLGGAAGFWTLEDQQFQLLTSMRRRAAEADGTRTVNFHGRGGKHKKKTRRKRRGKKRKTRKKRGGAVTEFLVKNDQASINAFFNEISTRQIDGSYVEHSPSDELGLEHLHDMMMESLLTGEYVEGIYGVTYAPNRYEGPYGRFFADYFDDMNSLTERLEIVSENNRFPNSVTQLQSAVEEQIILPHPGGESPNTIMDVDDLSGGRKRRRKKKTRKRKGGMEEPSTPPRPPKDNDRGTNRYPPGFTLPPPQVPVRTAPPQQATMRRRSINRREFRDILPGARAPTQRMIDEHNERFRREQNSRIRNVAGDVLEACTGSRCGLGGKRSKRKTRKRKRKKKTRRKKYRKRRTKKKSRRR